MYGARDRWRALAAGVQSRVSERLSDLWWTVMLRGLLAAALGLCALIWPGVSLAILVHLVGLYCLADGLVGVLEASRAPEPGVSLLRAVLGVVVGAVLLLWPDPSIRLLLVVFGAWALLTGIGQVVAARRADLAGSERTVASVVGGIAAGLGLILVVWPGTGVVAISWVIAVAGLLLAALLTWLALRLKRLQVRANTFARQHR